MELENLPENIVFYDGDCGFCNSSVQFILKKKKSKFHFIPLQSPISKEIIDKHNTQINLDTMYYLRAGKLYNRSSAALQIALGLKGAYPLFFGFYIIPKFLRDPFYTIIAKNRHKIKAGYCMIPTPEDQQYFIMD